MWLDTIKAHVREEINTQTAKICLRIFSIVWYSLESQGFVLEHPGENILLPPPAGNIVVMPVLVMSSALLLFLA